MSDNSLAEAISAYIAKRWEARLEKLEKNFDKTRKTMLEGSVELAEFNISCETELQREAQKYEPNAWLTDAAGRAKKISRVTHALKYTHTDAKGSSILASSHKTAEHANTWLSTASLSEPVLDMVCNAAELSIAGLLLLEDSHGKALITYVSENDAAPLESFAESPEQLLTWLEGFKLVLVDTELSSHKLAKQVYFPVSDGTYHLLSPLLSSSLAHALYQRITESRYSDEARAAREARKSQTYWHRPTEDFFNLVVQKFGGTKPQNVSQLNTQRKGQIFLFPAVPPRWKSQSKPPASTLAFIRSFERSAAQTLRFLVRYLKNRVNATSTVSIRDMRAQLVDQLIDCFVQQAALIQMREDWSGWSDSASLTNSEKYWLDPHNPDEQFQQNRELGDWQKDIASLFARWLNRKLRKGGLNVDDGEFSEWHSLMDGKLRELERDIGGWA
ncbi:type I-F CRISPR-associated protein Csy1 [Teredinibacter turnerae]|uniref:type I-F CRISPR-associated protein Csy1 n=1 Tax=Teredinibacter turnerae TaxID=2426 RepID=UPI0030D1E3FA